MRRHTAKLAIALGCLGLLLRFALAAASTGSDDADIWFNHASVIAEHGIGYLLDHSPSNLPYNHPPLMGYWSVLALTASDGKLHDFSVWMKLPGLLGELLSAFLLYHIWARRRPGTAALVFAAYAWSLPAILVSGYHCNTDCACAGLTLLSVYLLQDTRRFFWSGAALAAALNVKLMPLILVPVLLSQCRSSRELLRFGAGLALGVVPFVPIVVSRAFMMYTHMIRYGSQQLDWGINAFINCAWDTPPFDWLAAKIRAPFLAWARWVILLSVIVASAVAAIRRRPLGYEVGALAWALFLVLTSGYSVQYAVCVLPLLFAVDLRRATAYSLFAGGLLIAVYFKNMVWRLPLHALVSYYPFPRIGTLFGVLAWGVLATFVFASVRTLARRDPLVPARQGWLRILDHELARLDAGKRDDVRTLLP